MYKQGLALNSLQWLICHKTQLNLIIKNKITLKAQNNKTKIQNRLDSVESMDTETESIITNFKLVGVY